MGWRTLLRFSSIEAHPGFAGLSTQNVSNLPPHCSFITSIGRPRPVLDRPLLGQRFLFGFELCLFDFVMIESLFAPFYPPLHPVWASPCQTSLPCFHGLILALFSGKPTVAFFLTTTFLPDYLDLLTLSLHPSKCRFPYEY